MLNSPMRNAFVEDHRRPESLRACSKRRPPRDYKYLAVQRLSEFEGPQDTFALFGLLRRTNLSHSQLRVASCHQTQMVCLS